MNMFPHKITAYKYENNQYTRRVFNGVYWVESIAETSENKGESNSPAVTIIMPYKAFTADAINPGDLVVYGNQKEIKSRKELGKYYKVVTVKINACESTIDNVTIEAK